MKEDPSAYDTYKKRIKMRTLHVILAEDKKKKHKSRLAVDVAVTDPYFDLSTWNVTEVERDLSRFLK